MTDCTGWIVRSTAGRDKDELFCVLGADPETGRLLLANGKQRKAARPKLKSRVTSNRWTGANLITRSSVNCKTRKRCLTERYESFWPPSREVTDLGKR